MPPMQKHTDQTQNRAAKKGRREALEKALEQICCSEGQKVFDRQPISQGEGAWIQKSAGEEAKNLYKAGGIAQADGRISKP